MNRTFQCCDAGSGGVSLRGWLWNWVRRTRCSGGSLLLIDPLLLEAEDGRRLKSLPEPWECSHEFRPQDPAPCPPDSIWAPGGGYDSLVHPCLYRSPCCTEETGGLADANGVGVCASIFHDVCEVEYPLAISQFARPVGGLAIMFQGLLVGPGDIGGGVKGAIDGFDVASPDPGCLSSGRMDNVLFRVASLATTFP